MLRRKKYQYRPEEYFRLATKSSCFNLLNRNEKEVSDNNNLTTRE